MSADWGGDYSFLIHSIEERLSEQIPDRENASPPRNRNSNGAVGSPESGRKRRRPEDHGASPAERYEELGHSSRVEIGGALTAADKLKQAAELDELRLLNEQLRDKLRGLQDDFQRYKEKTLKQLSFMESENNKLKKTSSEKNDRYYDEKKKSQAKIRTLEAEISSLKESSMLDFSIIGSGSGTSTASAGGSASSSSSVAEWEYKFLELEHSITKKTSESKTLAKVCSELEEVNRKQQQEIVLLKAKIGRNVDSVSVVESSSSSSSSSNGHGETTTAAAAGAGGDTLLSLKRKCSELETSLRRKSRELERVEQKVKNQSLMEEELASSEAKLKRAQEAMERAKAVETSYQGLQEEKKEWNLMFKDIVAAAGGSSGTMTVSSSDAAVTPAMILRALSATQQKCAALLKSQGELEASNSELRKQLLASASTLRSASADKEEAFRQAEQVSSRLRLAIQQSSLYEGEVLSLRALIQSYDAEYKIGRNVSGGASGITAAAAAGAKNKMDDLLRMKDDMISGLRTELDKSRKEGKDLVSRLDEEIKKNFTALKPTSSASNAAADVKVRSDSDHVATTAAPTATTTEEEEQAEEKKTEEETIALLQQREKSLLEQLSVLKEEIIALQLFSGVDFFPAKTKILHMVDNPASQAMTSVRALLQTQTSTLPKDQLNALKKQNKQLVAELEISPSSHHVTDSAGVGDDGTLSDPSSTAGGRPHQANAAMMMTTTMMMDQSMNMTTAGAAEHSGFSASSSSSSSGSTSAAADSGKLNQRLKEMFKERITSFREAVYLLTGYKVDLYAADATTGGHARLRLRSMYADNPDDSLLFQWRGENLELMETPFASKLDSKLFAYLSTCNSVPAFLSNVTLELFDNQTFLG